MDSHYCMHFLPCMKYYIFNFIPVKVIVNDVHIRYEDAEADPSHPFTIGLLLENLSAQSTDEYWVI